MLHTWLFWREYKHHLHFDTVQREMEMGNELQAFIRTTWKVPLTFQKLSVSFGQGGNKNQKCEAV